MDQDLSRYSQYPPPNTSKREPRAPPYPLQTENSKQYPLTQPQPYFYANRQPYPPTRPISPINQQQILNPTYLNQPQPYNAHRLETNIISNSPHQQFINYGPKAQRVTCPFCHTTITTETKTQSTTKTHLAACCLFCFLCWPCVCLPYCMGSCQNKNHYCSNCKAFLGTYKS